MKRICSITVAGIATFVLLQSAEAYPRGGGGRSFSSAPHFSAPRSSAPTYRSSAPARSFSNASARSYAPRISAMPSNRSFGGSRRFSPGPTTLRNPTYTSAANRFRGDRTTAFNSRRFTPSNRQFAPSNRTAAVRSQGLNRERVIARYNANWNRHWDRGRDHWWHGHRCHFHRGFWFIYDPFPFYPYGYGFYPYGGYYDSAYYDDSYTTDEYASAPESDRSTYAGDARVSDVQSALAREGYYDGPVDGNFGTSTRNALRRYQRDHSLQVTGNIDRAVVRALRLR